MSDKPNSDERIFPRPRDDRFTSPFRIIINDEVVWDPDPKPDNATPAAKVQRFLTRKQQPKPKE